MSLTTESHALKILVVRPDRLGDVILSTPVFEVIKRHYPRCHLTVMVREQVAPLIRGMPDVDEVMVFDPEGKHKGFKGLRVLISEFRNKHFRIAIVLQTTFRVAAAVFFSGVRYRVGPLSRIHSFLFYNRGIRQGRSQVEMHETDYNLQLLRRLGIRVGTRHFETRVAIPTAEYQAAQAWLKEKGRDPAQPLIVVHPGMGGSALNWPEGHYVEFIRALLREGKQILLTGGPQEGALIERMIQALGKPSERLWSYVNTRGDAITFLGALYSESNVVVAPSTGPLHLAVALGCQVVTFYPPIRVQSALRWGPYVKDDLNAAILVPDNYCGEEFVCRGPLCNYFPCMRSLTVTQALEHTMIQLTRSQRR